MTDRSVRLWTIVIPVKSTPDAKSRLGASRGFALAIALDTVAAALQAADVVVVTGETYRYSFEELGAAVVTDPGGGLGAAVDAGIASVAAAEPVAVLLGDVPALQPAELACALELAEAQARSFVADAESTGTVLITALEARDHRPAFGENSRALHLAAGYVELPVPEGSGLRRDVDTADQLMSLGSRIGERTARFFISADKSII